MWHCGPRRMYVTCWKADSCCVEMWARRSSSTWRFVTPSSRGISSGRGSSWPLMEESLRNAVRAGVKIAFGTDVGVLSHGEAAKEFRVMVEAGMTPMQAVVAATRNAADLLGQLDNIGTIEAGKYADLIAVDANPLDDITRLEHVSFVMKQGTVHKTGGG